MSNIPKLYDVGLALGLKNHEIETIETNNEKSVNMASYKVLQEWKKKCIEKSVEGFEMKSLLNKALTKADLCNCIIDLKLEETAL